MNDGTDVKLLGCHERKAFGKIESHLIAEYGTRADARAVAFVDPGFVAVFKKRFVLIRGHGAILENPACLTSKLRVMVCWLVRRHGKRRDSKQKAQDSLTKILRLRVYREDAVN